MNDPTSVDSEGVISFRNNSDHEMLPNHNDNDSNVMPQGADGLVDPQASANDTANTSHSGGEEAAQSVNGP